MSLPHLPSVAPIRLILMLGLMPFPLPQLTPTSVTTRFIAYYLCLFPLCTTGPAVLVMLAESLQLLIWDRFSPLALGIQLQVGSRVRILLFCCLSFSYSCSSFFDYPLTHAFSMQWIYVLLSFEAFLLCYYVLFLFV